MYKEISEIAQSLLIQSENKIDLGLSRMIEFLRLLGNPHKKLNCIHVGGTNGKGSTVKYLEGMLKENGLVVGVFHSPYYEVINDQITVNGTYINDDELVHIIETFKKVNGPKLTEFELLTVIALYYFSVIKKVDIALIEVGMGGEDDSTNVIEPIASIITNVGMDHKDFLGDSLIEIARKKAGIIKQETPLISSVIQKEVQLLMLEKCRQLGSDCYFINQHFTVESNNNDSLGEKFTFGYNGQKLEDISIPIACKHQIQNAALALMTYVLLAEKGMVSMNETYIRNGLNDVKHEGRFEIISTFPFVILDGAHNVEAIEALVKTVQEKFTHKQITIIFSAFKDKPIREMVAELAKLKGNIIFTTVPSPRSITGIEQHNIANITHSTYEENWKLAITEGLQKTKQNHLLIITGSLNFISVVRKYLKK